MGVLRYRDVREVPPPAVVDVRDPSLLDRVLALSTFAAATVGRLHRPGVTRFTSIESADAAREAALLERMRRRGAALAPGDRVKVDPASASGERS